MGKFSGISEFQVGDIEKVTKNLPVSLRVVDIDVPLGLKTTYSCIVRKAYTLLIITIK